MGLLTFKGGIHPKDGKALAKEAEYVAGRVREKLGVDHILINNIGTVIGSHTGPGVVAVFCMGEKR